jgi:LmbE family N-acetylglucosaminyl deacetylase
MNVLILAPHTDDGEFGCGGTISRMTSHGHNVYYVAFSAAKNLIIDEKLPIPINTLEEEVSRATKILGISKQNLTIYDFPLRNFLQYRQKILDTMVLLNKELKPDLVFLPSTTETHQDHQVISAEGFRAFKKTTIFGYELPWNNLSFKADVFITLEEKEIQNKIESILQYKSQSHRDYLNKDFFRCLARVRGTQVGVPYAESFEIVRLIINKKMLWI